MSYAQAKAKHDGSNAGSGNGGGNGEPPRELMCAANGCPLRWSTSIGHVCRFHAVADKDRWPEVTQGLQWDETERARRNGEPKPHVDPLSRDEKREILTKLAALPATWSRMGAKDWALELQTREKSGERLTLAQKTAWREALGQPITGAIPSWEQTPEDYAAGQPIRRAA